MMPLTDELLRRRLAERAATAGAAPLTTSARSIATGPRPRDVRPGGRRAVLGSLAASIVVGAALFAGLLLRTSPAIGPSSSAGAPPTAPLAATQPGVSAPALVSAPPPGGEITEWTAIDWRRLSTVEFPLPDSAAVLDAVAFGDGFVAVGTSGSGGRIWRSLDSVTWAIVDADWQQGLELRRIVLVGDRLVVFGQREGSAGDIAHGMETWSSPDGLSWVPGPPAPIAFRGSAAFRSTPEIVGGPLGVLARGEGWTFLLGPDLTAWTDVTPTWAADAQVGALAAGDRIWLQPGATGLGDRGVSTGAIWTSTGGRTWSPATVQDPAGVILETFRVAGGYVAIGTPANVGCRGCFGGAIVIARIAWFSADGSHWTRMAGSGGDGDDRILGASFAGDGRRLLAFGQAVPRGTESTPPGPVISETVDGRAWTSIQIGSTGTLPAQMNEGLTVGRHGVIELPGPILELASGPAAWWGQAVEAP